MNNRAEMGIGSLILFIAAILVAAVAASIFISQPNFNSGCYNFPECYEPINESYFKNNNYSLSDYTCDELYISLNFDDANLRKAERIEYYEHKVTREHFPFTYFLEYNREDVFEDFLIRCLEGGYDGD